jgi:hypothetical protein
VHVIYRTTSSSRSGEPNDSTRSAPCVHSGCRRSGCSIQGGRMSEAPAECMPSPKHFPAGWGELRATQESGAS